MKFELWIDSDSLSKSLRPIVLKAAVSLDTAAYFVADRELPDVKQFIADDTFKVRSQFNDRSLKSKIRMIVVKTGENSADDYIVENAPEYSLCITHDIPLAERLLNKNCFVIDDRGETYTKDNIRQMLGERAINNELRIWGVFDQQQKKIGKDTVKAFADNFNSMTTKLVKLQL